MIVARAARSAAVLQELAKLRPAVMEIAVALARTAERDEQEKVNLDIEGLNRDVERDPN